MRTPQFPIIYSMALTVEQGLQRGESRTSNGKPGALRIRNAHLIYLKNPGCFNDGRFFLALGETLGAVAVNVDTGEPFAVMVKHGDLPVLVFTPSVALHAARLLYSLFFHDGLFPQVPELLQVWQRRASD